MPLDCPRCASTMKLFTLAAARADAPPIVADTCERCGGIWLDGDEVVSAYPRLGPLAADPREAAHEATPRPGGAGGIGRCPRCGGASLELPFGDGRVDCCAACHGVWIDGSELVALGARAEAPPPPALAGGHYRTNAASAAQQGLVACARCRAVLPLAHALATSDGPMCEACGLEFEASDSGALDLSDVAALRRAGVDPRDAADVPRAASGRSFLGDLARSLAWLLLPRRACAAHGFERCPICADTG